MNYIKQLNAFYELLIVNPLSSSALCLYSVLLHINNKCNWITEFTIANSTLQSFTRLSRVALDRARNELVQKKYIKYKKGSGNQAGKYTIIDLIVRFDTQNDTQDNTQSNTQNDTQDNTQSENINKLKHKQETKTINKEKNIKKEKFVKPTIDEIKKYCIERKNNINPEQFYDFYEAKGWKVGNNAMKDWKACVRTWERRNGNTSTSATQKKYQSYSQREYTNEEVDNFYDSDFI